MNSLFQSVLFRRILISIVFFILILGSLMLGLYLFFPRDKLRTRLEYELTKPGMPLSGFEVSIQNVDISLIRPGFQLEKITLKRRQADPESGIEVPTKREASLVIDSVNIYIPRWDLLWGVSSLSHITLEASLYSGSLSIDYRIQKADSKKPTLNIEIEGSNIQLAQAAKHMGFPAVSGALSLKGNLFSSSPQDPNKPQQAKDLQGTVQVQLDSVVLGNIAYKIPLDKFPIRDPIFISSLQSLAPDGLPFPPLSVGRIDTKLSLLNQEIKIEKWVSAPTKSSGANTSIQLLATGNIKFGIQPGPPLLQLDLQIGSIRGWIDQLGNALKASFDDRSDKEIQIQKWEVAFPLAKQYFAKYERPDKSIILQLAGPTNRMSLSIKKE